MKKVISVLLMALVLPFAADGSVIVNNVGTGSEDSISVYVASLDSIGNPVEADSFFVSVFKSNVNGVVFSDSGGSAMIGLDTVASGGGITHYYYHRAVADIDGAGAPGGYTGCIVAKRNSGPLLTPNQFSFQIVSEDFDGGYLTNTSRALDSLGKVIDSLESLSAGLIEALDSLKSQDDWIGDVRYSGFDNILQLRGLHIRGTTGSDTAFIASAAGGGTGAFFQGGTTGGDGIRSSALSNGTHGLRLGGAGTGHGLSTWGGETGHGIYSQGGSLGGAGTRFRAVANGDPGLILSGDGNGRDFDASETDSLLAAAASISIGEKVWEYDSSDVSGLQAMGTLVKDTSAYQGSASGLTATDVADSVWNRPFAGPFSAGSMGDSLSSPSYVQGSAIGSGSGAFAVSITVYDSTIAQVIPGVSVHVRNLSQTALVAISRSDVSGSVLVNLDADSFLVVASAAGYQFSPFDSLVVSGGASDTIYGVQFYPGIPSSPSLCRVYGHLYTVDGQPETGATVSAFLPEGVQRSGNLVISPFSVSAVSDSTGYFFLDLIPSDSLLPDTAQYEFTITRTDGTILRQRLMVPDADSWQLTW
jgi:hypothetical protein